MKNYLKIINAHKSSAGFTLIELMVAASISTVVIAVGGYGLVSIMGANKRAEDQNLRRVELNRALDFMADEVKMAQSIAIDPNVNVSTIAPDFPSTCHVTNDEIDCPLILQIPGVDETPNANNIKNQRVVYYVQSPPKNSPWLGPRVIYRWGPDFKADGTYSNPDNPDNWISKPLVDRIEGNLASPNSNCPTGWSPNLTADDRDSFYACVQPTATGSATGRVAEIFLLGEVKGTYGSSAPHQVVRTRAFARSVPTP